MLGLALLYVGAVLFVNGFWMLGYTDDREVGLMNLFTGGLTFLINIFIAYTKPFGEPASYLAAGQGLFFSFTYLWVALNNIFKLGDGRALGWYCLFVAISTLPSSYVTFQAGDARFGIIWLSWGGLWFLFFLLLALKKEAIAKFTAYATIAVGVLTCWIPGYLLLLNRW